MKLRHKKMARACRRSDCRTALSRLIDLGNGYWQYPESKTWNWYRSFRGMR